MTKTAVGGEHPGSASTSPGHGVAAESEAVETGWVNVERATPAHPRNPVLRAFVSVGRLMSGACQAVEPTLKRLFTTEGRAAANLRARFERVCQDLISTRAGPRQLADSLSELARAQQQWDELHPEARGGPGGEGTASGLDHLVKQRLDWSWSADTTRALARAVNGERVRQALFTLRSSERSNDAARLLQRLQELIPPVARQHVRDRTLRRLGRRLERLAGRSTDIGWSNTLRGLTAALLQWWELHPEAESDFRAQARRAVDERFSDDATLFRLLERASDGKRPLSQASASPAPPGTPAWTGAQIQAAIQDAARDRAFAAIDRSLLGVLDAIHRDHLADAIQLQAEEALATATRLLMTLYEHGALKLSESEGSVEERLQNLMLQIVDARLIQLSATDADVTALIEHLSIRSLEKVWNGPPGTRITQAAEKEVIARAPRLKREIGSQILAMEAGGGPHPEAPPSPVELVRLTRTLDLAVQGAATFNGPLSKEFGQTLDEIAPVVTRATTLLATSLTEARNEAKRRIRAVGDILARTDPIRETDSSSRIRELVPACKAMTRAVERYLAAPRPARGPGRAQEFEADFELLLREMMADTQPEGTMSMHRPLAVHTSLSRGAIRTLVEALKKAAELAWKADLPELHTDLRHAWQALECMRKLARSLGGGLVGTFALPRASPITDAQALDIIKRDYCVAIGSRGQVGLTAGRCPPRFTAAMKQVVQRRFSDADKATYRLAGGCMVPAQFKKDAERHGTELLDQYGRALIDRSGWATLPPEEKQRRIEAGYRRLLDYYGGNETQTRAILQTANQTLTMAFEIAANQAADSPVILEGFGPGRVNVAGLNGTHLAVVQFETSDDHRPRLQMRYEVRGGYFIPQGNDPTSLPTVFLDLDRSYVAVTLEALVNSAGDALELVGVPTYEVHLVPNWAQCSYPPPDRQLLRRRELELGDLYRDLVLYAQSQRPQALPALIAMQELTRIKPGPDATVIGDALKKFHHRRLRAGAPEPLPQLLAQSSPSSRAAERLRDYLDQPGEPDRIDGFIRESSSLIDQLLEELDSQLPEDLLESFIAYLPGHL